MVYPRWETALIAVGLVGGVVSTVAAVLWLVRRHLLSTSPSPSRRRKAKVFAKTENEIQCDDRGVVVSSDLSTIPEENPQTPSRQSSSDSNDSLTRSEVGDRKLKLLSLLSFDFSDPLTRFIDFPTSNVKMETTMIRSL